MVVNSGSFSDPFGRVFEKDGKIYRCIFEPGVKDYEAARDAGIYDELIKAKLLLPHKEVDLYDLALPGTVHCLMHPRLPMISYPWEWPFSILKEAARIHLDVMERLLRQGFWLRDASALNVQYDGTRLRLIDTLSIGRRIPNSPWIAYGQFCSHFLAPLAMAAYRDIRTLATWRNFIDGYPLDLAANMLPFWKRCKPGLFFHLILHARFQRTADRKEDIGSAKPARKAKLSDRGLFGLVRSLDRTISGLSWKRVSQVWEAYGEIRTYNAEDVKEKSAYVDRVVQQLKPAMVWDLGANTGEFSMIAASHGAFVVAIDGDPACTEKLFQRAYHEKNGKSVLPLTMDLANPSPGLGWNGRERLDLRDRGPADLLLALALIHHLVFSSYVPLSLIAEWFANLTRHLLVEFVPPTDPMVQKLLQNRNNQYHPYSLEVFKSSFGQYFVFADQTVLRNGRILFLCKNKAC